MARTSLFISNISANLWKDSSVSPRSRVAAWHRELKERLRAAGEAARLLDSLQVTRAQLQSGELIIRREQLSGSDAIELIDATTQQHERGAWGSLLPATCTAIAGAAAGLGGYGAGITSSILLAAVGCGIVMRVFIFPANSKKELEALHLSINKDTISSDELLENTAAEQMWAVVQCLLPGCSFLCIGAGGLCFTPNLAAPIGSLVMGMLHACVSCAYLNPATSRKAVQTVLYNLLKEATTVRATGVETV